MVNAVVAQNYREIAEDAKRIAAERGFQVTPYGSSFEGRELYAFSRILNARFPTVMIVAGTHGDEPAGVKATLSYMRDSKLPDNVNLIVYPCLNPDGLSRNMRCNSNGVDLNRKFEVETLAGSAHPEATSFVCSIATWLDSVDLVINLHEDNPDVATDFGNPGYPNGAYMYFNSRHPLPDSFTVARIRSAWSQKGISIASDNSIYGDTAIAGIVDYGATSSNTTLRDFALLDNFMIKNFRAVAITIETRTVDPMRVRVSAHLVAIESAIASLTAQPANFAALQIPPITGEDLALAS
jgi:hypothetical protein